MRPLRALAVLAVLLGIWSNWRFQEARATYAAMLGGRGDVTATAISKPHLAEQLAEFREPVWHSVVTHARESERNAPPVLVAMAPTAGQVAPLAAVVSVFGRPEATLDIAGDPAFAAAQHAYRALAVGDRRLAAARFEAAVEAAPAHTNADMWGAELRRLKRRWSLDAYSLLRAGGGSVAPNAAPLLGGGQSGARVGYTLDPLAARPLELFARLSIAQDWLEFDGRSAQAALGAAWRPLGRHGPSLSAERLVGIGQRGRDAWAARIAGGAAHIADTRLPLDLEAYAEAGVVGLKRGDLFAGGQAYALYPLFENAGSRVLLGGGAWGSVQDTAAGTLSRIEIGPSARLVQRIGASAIELRADYRQRVAGDAEPGSGPAVTLVTQF